MNWQPIESIPRDQSTVLICMPGSTDAYYVVTWADDDDGIGLGWRCPRSGEVLLTDSEIASCHLRPMWQRIHAPPTSLSAGHLA